MVEFHKIFDECVKHFRIKGIELAEAAGRTEGNISKIRNGKVGITIEEFSKLIEHCEDLAPGFKDEFARRLGTSNLNSESLALSEIADQIESGRLSDDEVAKLSSELADVVVAISKRLKSVVRKDTVLI